MNVVNIMNVVNEAMKWYNTRGLTCNKLLNRATIISDVEDQTKLQPHSILRILRDQKTYTNPSYQIVEHNYLWKTFPLFINKNREEITRHIIEY